MKTVCYIIPYSAKAMRKLKEIQKRYKAIVAFGMNEEITITAKERYLAKIEKFLADVV
jgi:cyclopropane fatty-acyl-phospholipid synthase-like methyltransferase